ncbi:MAG: hypothetical protein GY796_13935, partial [Chloroflexi bacterium]|nr:hypothetical protein [Chloroflexota bacterium]
ADTATSLIDTPAREDEIFWYAPAVNEMDAYLTAGFDLTAVNQANLGYSVWYDLEDIYDFAYISISTDGGQTWDQLPPRIASVGEYGAGYNGRSADKQDNQNGWLKESISLNDYVGHNVLIRFDVLTDSGITGQGFALDNLSISEYGYEATFQDGPEGWQPAGFVRTGQQLPQKWALLLIEEDSATVTPIPLNNLNQAQATFNLGKAGGILTIMPQTPFITQPANYWLIIDQPSN